MRFPITFKIPIILFVLCFFGSFGAAASAAVPELATITLEKPVYFLGTDGSPAIAGAGQYIVEPAEDWIRLIPDERRNALLIEANSTNHEEVLSDPMAISLHGKGQDNPDVHHVIYLFPSGRSLDAVGTYSGIRTRGLFKRIASRPRIRQAVQNVRSTVQTMAQKVGQAVPKFLPPDLIQAVKALGPDIGPVFQCLKAAQESRKGILRAHIQQLQKTPKDYV